jgi:hypothetical protein
MSPDRDQLEPELESFRRILEVGASIDSDDLERHDPPSDLWDRISAELGLDGPDAGETVPRGPSPLTPGGSVDDGSASGPVVNLADRRRSWTRPLLAAAAVLVAVASIGVIVSSQQPDEEVVASVELDVLQGDASGEAELVEVDGERRLVITAEDMATPPEGHHYEVWLIDEAITAPQSLGELTLADGTVSIVVPDGIDPAEFPIVDINLQEDGVKEHSGLDTSVLRGVLA